jgi:hypothetical protein
MGPVVSLSAAMSASAGRRAWPLVATPRLLPPIPAPRGLQHKHSEEEVLDAFRLFDPEGTGTVPVSVFRDAMQHLAGLGDAELDTMIEEAVAISRQEAARRAELDAARAAKRQAKRADRRAGRDSSPRPAAAAPPPAAGGAGGGEAVAVAVAAGGAGAIASGGAGRPAARAFRLGIGPASLPPLGSGGGSAAVPATAAGAVATGMGVSGGADALPTERVFAVDDSGSHVAVRVPTGGLAVPPHGSRARLAPLASAGGAAEDDDADGSPVASAAEVLSRVVRPHSAASRRHDDAEAGDGGDMVASLFDTAARDRDRGRGVRGGGGEDGDGSGGGRSGRRPSESGSASGSEARTPHVATARSGGTAGAGSGAHDVGGGALVPRLVGVAAGEGGGAPEVAEAEAEADAEAEAVEELIYYETFVRVMFSY